MCPTDSHVYFLHKRLNYDEKIFFLSLVHKNEVEKKNRKANEISNYGKLKLRKLFYLTLRW